jgi:nucleoside-diphosphate-sugar epimerase
MHTLITGAGGFVGSALLARLSNEAAAGATFTALDLSFGARSADPRIEYVEGRISDPATLERALADRPECVFHLATVAGVGAATNFGLGYETNLSASLALLEALRKQGARPRFVYSSSAATICASPFETVTDNTLPMPNTSYGAHKLVNEVLINDYSRQQFIDGVALRLPGILARPEGSKTMLSAFLSNIFYAAKRHAPFILPMAPNVTTWMMSRRCCVDNLVHAARLPPARLGPRRNWSLPVVNARMDELVAALARRFGNEVLAMTSYETNDAAAAMFGLPRIETPGAEALGFRSDGSIDQLVDNVVEDNAALS